MASSSSSSSFPSSTSLLLSEPEPWRENTRPRLPPGHLLDIPDGPLFDIFSIYLHIEDVCNLDSALCNKGRRPYFLQLISTKVLLFNREEIDILNPYQGSLVRKALGAAALNWILKRGIHLAGLRLRSDVRGTDAQKSRNSIASLVLNNRLDKLETVNVYCCSYIKDADFGAILSKCDGSMKSINIDSSGVIQSSAVHIKRCAKLEAFSSKGNESAADLDEIFQSCRKLRMVDLNSFRGTLTDEMVQSVGAHCPLLEHIDIAGCDMVSDTAIRTLVESCSLLQFADLQRTNITDTTVVSLCKLCPHLKGLNIGHCRSLSDAAVTARPYSYRYK
jgi:hypothetical protein